MNYHSYHAHFDHFPNPNFLPRDARRGRACVFQYRKAHKVHQSHQVPQKLCAVAAARNLTSTEKHFVDLASSLPYANAGP
jgi:hypothetical protein